MADSNWMFGTDNYQPTNFSVDDWVNELKTKANQAYENISPKDNSDSIVSADIRKADELAKRDIANRKAAYQSQYGNRAYEQEYRDIQKKAKEAIDTFGAGLRSRAYDPNYANDDLAKEYRNNPNFQKEYDKLITQSGNELTAQDLARKEDLYGSHGYTAEQAQEIHNNPLLTALKGAAQGLGNGIVSTLTGIARAPEEINNYFDTKDLIADGTASKVAELKAKDKEREDIQNELKVARDSGDMDRAEFLAGVLSSPDMQPSEEDQAFLNSPQYQKYQIADSINSDLQQSIKNSQNAFGKSPYQARKEMLEASTGRKDLTPSTLGMNFIKEAVANYSDVNGLTAEIMSSIPLSIISAGPLGLGTMLDNAFSTMSDLWQKNKANPDVMSRLSPHDFNLACMEALAGSIMDWCGDTIIGNTGKQIMKFGPKTLRRDIEKTLRDTLETVETQFPNLSADEQRKLAGNLIAIRSQQITNDAILHGSGPANNIVQRAQEGTAAINGNLLQAAAGGTIAATNTLKNGFRSAISGISNKINEFNEKFIGNPKIAGRSEIASDLANTFANSTERMAKLAKVVAPIAKPATIVGNYAKELLKESAGEAVSNLGAEYFNKRAEATYEHDESKRMTAAEGAKAAGEGFAQGTAMGAVTMGGAHGVYGIKKLLSSSKTNITNDSTFNGVYNSLKDAADKTEESAAIGDTISSLTKQLNKSSKDTGEQFKKSLNALMGNSNIAGSIETVSSDILPNVRLINTESQHNKDLIANADKATKKLYNQVVSEQEEALKLIKGNQEKKDKLIGLQDTIMKHAVSSLRGLEGNDRVRSMHGNAFVKNYALAETDADKKALQNKFETAYTNSLLKEKNVTQEDAEHMAHSVFTEMTGDQKNFNAEIDSAVESNPQSIIGSKAYNIVDNIVKQKFKNSSNKSSSEEDYKKYRLSRIANVFKNHGITNDYLTRLNQYDNAGDKLVSAIAHKDSGNFKKARQSFSEFVDAMNKHDKITELNYLADVYGQSSVDFGEYSGKFSKGFKRSTLENIKSKIPGQEVKRDSYYINAMDSKNSDVLMDAMAKAINVDTESLDEDEYQKLIEKGNKNPGLLTDQETENLRSNAYLRGDATGLNIYYQKRGISTDQVNQEFKDITARIDPVFQALKSSETILDQVSDNQIKELSATGSEGKKRLQDSLKKFHMDAVFVVQDITPNETDEAKKTYGIVPINYAAFAPAMEFVQRMRTLKATKISYTKENISEAYGNMAKYYLDHKSELEKKHTFNTKINDFEYIVKHVFYQSPFGTFMDNFVNDLPDDHALQIMHDACMYVAGKPDMVNKYGTYIKNHPNINQLTSYKTDEEKVGIISYLLTNASTNILNLGDISAGSVLIKYVDGLDDLIDAINFGKQTRNIIQNRNFKDVASSVQRATRINISRSARDFRHVLMGYRKDAEAKEEKEKEKFNKANDKISSKLGESTQEIIEDSKELMESKDPQDQARAVELAKSIQQRINNVGSEILFQIANLNAVHGITLDDIAITQNDLNYLNEIKKNAERSINLTKGRLANMQPNEAKDQLMRNLERLQGSYRIIGGLINYLTGSNSIVADDAPNRTRTFIEAIQSADSDRKENFYYSLVSSNGTNQNIKANVDDIYFNKYGNIQLPNQTDTAATYNFGDIRNDLDRFFRNTDTILDNNIYDDRLYAADSADLVAEISNYRRLMHNQDLAPRVARFIAEIGNNNISKKVLRTIYDNAKKSDKYGTKGRDYDTWLTYITTVTHNRRTNTDDVTPELEQLVIDNLNTLIANLQSIATSNTAGSNGEQFYNRLVQILFDDNSLNIQQIRTDFSNFDLHRFSGNNSTLLSVFANDPNIKNTINNPQYKNQIRHLINIVNELSHIQYTSTQAYQTLQANITQARQGVLDALADNIANNPTGRYLNGSIEVRNEIINNQNGTPLAVNELAYVRNRINSTRATTAFNNIMQAANGNGHNIQTEYNEGGRVQVALQNGLNVIHSTKPSDTLNAPISIDANTLLSKHSKEDVYKKIFNIVSNFQNRLQGNPNHDSLINELKRLIKKNGYDTDQVINQVIDTSYQTDTDRVDFIKSITTGDSDKFIRAFFSAVDAFNQNHADYDEKIYTTRAADNTNVRNNRVTGAHNNQVDVAFNTDNHMGRSIFDYFINHANLNDQLVIDDHKFNHAFLNCSSAEDITNSILATNAGWSADFADFSKSTEELAHMFGRVSNDAYINSKYNVGNLVDRLFINRNDTKVGIETLQAGCIQVAINAAFSANKLESSQDQESLDKFPNLDAAARAQLLTLQGVNRDEILDTITSDIKKLMPFLKNTGNEQLAEGFAVRALQLLEHERYIKLTFVNIKTGEVHDSASGISNQNCVCLVTYNDKAKYDQMKSKVNKITKWNQIYHVDYFNRVYGSRVHTNLEAVDHDGYINNQVQWGRRSHDVLRDLASYKDANGHATNVTNDAHFDDFIKTYKDDADRSYVYNALLNAVASHPADPLNNILEGLYNGSIRPNQHVNYFENNSTNFTFSQKDFRDHMNNICYLAIGADNNGHKASVGIINQNFIDRETRAIFNSTSGTMKNPFVFIDGENLYSNTKSGIFAPDVNILSIATLDSKPSAFNVYSGLDTLKLFTEAGYSLDQLTNNEVDNILIDLYNHVAELKNSTNNPADYENSPHYRLYTALGLKDITGTGEYADTVRNKVKTAISDKLKEVNFLLGIRLFEHDHNQNQDLTLYDYLIENNATQADITARVQDLASAYTSATPNNKLYIETTLNNHKVRLTQWHLAYFYHRVTPNNRLYTCGHLMSDRETKGNRCVWSTALRYPANEDDDIEFSSALDQTRLENIFYGRDRHGNDDTTLSSISNLLAVLSANLGLSVDKVYRMNYWRNIDQDGKNWSLGSVLTDLLRSKEFTDEIKYAAEHDGRLRYITNKDGKVVLALDNLLEQYKVATVDTSGQSSQTIKDNKFYKKLSFTGGDWTENANSIPILNNLIEMYKANNSIFTDMGNMLNEYGDYVIHHSNSNSSPYVFNRNDLINLRNTIQNKYRNVFRNEYFRFVHEGDGLTSGPGLSNGQFNDITAFELLRNTSANDPRYSLFNMTGYKTREFFDKIRSDATFASQVMKDPDVALDIYLATAQDTSMIFHTYFREAITNLTSNNNKEAGKKLLALLALFADGYGMPMYGNTQDVSVLLNPDVTRKMMKPFMTQYVYGAGIKSLAVKADELAYKQWNDQLQGAGSSYTLDEFLNQLLTLSSNNTFNIRIATNPNNNPWSDTHSTLVTVTKKDGKLYFNGASRDDVQKCWDLKRVSISYRDNITNGANEFIKGTLGVAISKATDKVLGITRVHNKAIAQAGSIVSSIAEIGLVARIRSIYKARREAGDVWFTREDRDKIEQYAYDILNIKVGVSAGLAGGELKSQLKRDVKPKIEALLNDIEGYTISTFYPGVEGTTGLTGTSGGKLPSSKSPALTPEANHTIDSYIANAAHNTINDLHIRDVFDAMITSADSFNEVMKAANQAHMGMLYVQNAKFHVAQSVRNAINVFNTQIKSDLGNDPEAKAYIAKTFSDFGMSNVNPNLTDLGLNKYADELQVQSVQDDLNKISQLEAILNGNVNNLYSNGYFGAMEGTTILVQNGQVDPKMRGCIVSMIKFLCERNNITYTETNGTRTYTNGINTNGNLDLHATGMNVRIFNTLIENNMDSDYKVALEALCDSTRSQNQEFTLKNNIFDMKILNQKASLGDLINAVRNTSPANAARAEAAIRKAARAVINRDSIFVNTALNTLNAMNDMLHRVQSQSTHNGIIDEELQNRNLFTQTVQSFNDWDTNQNKTNSDLYSAITGALQEQFDLGQIIGPDLKRVTDEVFARLSTKKLNEITKAQILLEIDNTQNNINTVDANYNQKLNLLLAATKDTSIQLNDNLDNTVYNVLSNAKLGDNVYIHKDTDISWDTLRDNQIVESSINTGTPSTSADAFIHNFIDSKLIEKYGKVLRDNDVVLVEGHNTTDLLAYIRLKHLQSTGAINKNAKIIYTRDILADHSQTGALRTQDAIIANLLESRRNAPNGDERPTVMGVVFSYLGDNVDSELVDSIGFWGKPELVKTDSHRSTESFAVPDSDLRGRKLKALSLRDTAIGYEIKNTVRSRNKIDNSDFIQIDTRYDRDLISTVNDSYNRPNARIDISFIARTLANEYYNDMDPVSTATQRFRDTVDTSTMNFSPASWLKLTAKSAMLSNAGFNSNTVDELSRLFTASHNTNEGDTNILNFGEFTEHVHKGDVVGIPISIGLDGKLYLPQNNNFCFQLINALGGRKVLRDIENEFHRRQNTDQKSDPIFTMPVTFRNVTSGDIVTTQIQFINLNNKLIPQTELTQYMYQTPEGVHKWDYGKLIQSYSISGKLPSAEDVYAGRNALDGAGNRIGQRSGGFYQLPLLPNDFDLNNAINSNIMSTTGASSYMDYIKAHLAKSLGGKEFTGTYHLLSETLNIYKDNTSNTMNNNIKQYTAEGSISMEKAKEYNKLPIGQSDAAQGEVAKAMEKGNELSGITKSPYSRSKHFRNVFHYSWNSELDKYIDQAMYDEAEQSADQYTNTIKQWINEDSKNISDDLSYLNDIADMLGNSQFKMHIKLIDHPDVMAGASAIDMNNVDNHMNAAVVVSTRRDMARRPGLSKAEMLVHEIAHNHFRLMTPHQYMEATKLYNVASKYLTPKALEDAGASKAEAEDIYKYIFQNANADSVHEFLAYALTNRYVIRALNNSALNDKLAVALRSRAIGLARKAISFITGSHGMANEPNVAVTKVRDLFNTCIMATHDWDRVRKNVYRYNSNEKIRKEYTSVINEKASNFKQGLFHSIDSQLKGLPNWDTTMGQIFDSIDVLKDGFAKDIVKEFEGTSDNSLIYVKCAYKYRSQLDSAKGVSIGTMKDTINNLLNFYGIKGSEVKLRKNLSEVIMRLDLGSLNKSYDADEIINFLKPDNKERTNEITRLEKAINNPWMLNKANELANYLITGTSKSGIRYTNAYQIASMYGTGKAKNVNIDSDIYRDIDSYITLKAIDNMIHSKSDNNPITDSNDGVLTILNKESEPDEDGNTQKGDALLKHLMAVQEGLKNNEITKVWGNSTDAYKNMPKGYIFPNSQSDCRVRLIAASDIDRWNTIGYSRISDPININGHQMVWIGTKHHAFAPEITGLFSKAAKNFIHGKNNQVNVYGEDFMYGQLSSDEQAQMFIKVLDQVKTGTFKSLAGSNTNLVPRFDNAGNIVAFDVEMNNLEKEEYMGSDLDISSSMANVAGMITERSVTPETNKETTKALLNYYKENKAGKKWTWVNENHEMWKFLPDTVKQEVENNPDLKGKGFPIETKYLDRVFGKERFTFANWSEKKLLQGFAEESFVDNFAWIMNNSLGLKLEGFAQKLSQWGKNLIVVKSIVPSVANVMSNVGTLCACENMTLKQTIQYMKDGYNCIQDYLECLRKKEEFETQLAIWRSEDPNKRKPNEDLRLQASIAQMNRTIDNNPASELFKAGLYNASPMFSVNYHKPVAVQLAEKYGGKVTSKMVDNSLVKNLFNLQGSPVYKMSMSLATFNDFAARYALYKHMQDKAQKDGKNFNMDKFIKRSDELFVNYNTPQPMLLEYLDNMGLASFMKYFIGVQKGVYNSFKDHPVSMLAKIGGAAMFGLHLPSIVNSMISLDGVMNRFKMPGQMMADNIGSLPTEAVISSIM